MARISSSNPKLSSNRLFNKKLIPVKVKDIILDGSTDRAANYGGYDSVGLIFYNKVQIKNDGLNTNPDADEILESKGFDGVAKPLFPFLKYYPLINEVVLIISTTSKDYLDNRLSRIDYYFPPINLWNHPHHNTLPAVQNYSEDKSEIFKNEDYEQAGLLRRAVDGEVDINIPLGKYFKEQLNIKPLLPYEGDYIVEGRFGNTIRLGATARSETIPKEQKNNWSNGAKGEVGDPITIIRNGQAVNLDNQGWVHTLENINTDPSSIYLTSNQKIDNFAIAAPECWYSFGLNAIIPQNDNEEAKKFLDSPVDFMVAEEVEVKESTPPPTESTPTESTSTESSESTETISEEEAGFNEKENTQEAIALPTYRITGGAREGKIEILRSDGTYGPLSSIIKLSDGEKRVIFFFGKQVGPRLQITAKHTQGIVFIDKPSSGGYEENIKRAKTVISQMDSKMFREAVLNGGVGNEKEEKGPYVNIIGKYYNGTGKDKEFSIAESLARQDALSKVYLEIGNTNVNVEFGDNFQTQTPTRYQVDGELEVYYAFKVKSIS